MTIYFGIGTNLGNREENIREELNEIDHVKYGIISVNDLKKDNSLKGQEKVCH